MGIFIWFMIPRLCFLVSYSLSFREIYKGTFFSKLDGRIIKTFLFIYSLIIASDCVIGFVPVIGAPDDCLLPETGFSSGKGKELKERNPFLKKR